MGILDFLFGSGVAVVRDNAQLKELLFRVAGAGDQNQLERLCRANRETIVQYFPEWQKIPMQVRTEPAIMENYAQGLIAVAQVFADRLGEPMFLQRLMGPPQSNPLVQWQERLEAAQQHMDELRYAKARELLNDLLIDVRGLQGSGADAYLRVTLGCLGECYFQVGEAEKAGAPFEEALQLCARTGDAEGIATYLRNLYEVHRYLGQCGPAADYADRLADAFERLGRSEEATRYRKQATLVRRGEPLNRVIAVMDGQRYELDEVRLNREQGAQFLFERNRITLRPTEELIKLGEEYGRTGRWEEALEVFQGAAAVDPFDPNPRSWEGFTLLNLRRYAEAVKSFQATEELAPGWFHCRAYLWLAEKLVLGEIDHETFLALRMLEDGPESPEEKVCLAEQFLARAAGLAPLHLLHGKSLVQLGRLMDARAAYQEGLACSPEPDVKTRLLVELGLRSEDPQEKDMLLRQAVALGGNLVAAAMATLFLHEFSPT